MLKKLALLCVLVSGCYSVTVKGTAVPSGQTYEERAHMFLFGLAGDDVNVPCTPATVNTSRGVIDWFLGVVTFWLYTPYSVEVTCAGPGSDQPGPGSDQQRSRGTVQYVPAGSP